MNSLSLSPAVNVGGEGSSFVSGSYFHLQKSVSVAERQKGLFSGISGAWLRQFGHSKKGCRRSFYTVARIKKGQKHEYPWPEDIDPNLKSGHLSYLSHFKPLTEKPKTVTLEFEKPLVELEKKIIDVRKMADETGLDFSDQINLLESKYQQAIKDLYTHLTPIQRLNIARHPNRPTFLDHVLNITDKWVELHGDRAGYDDPAIVTGLGSIDGKTYMFIGHQKGRNTKENIQRNFGMPTPHGYRKALRVMRYADHHGLPIITFIDTPGAFADLKSEELGQGEAIAFNLRAMFGFKVPIVTVVIGEGGSGGALAIGDANDWSKEFDDEQQPVEVGHTQASDVAGESNDAPLQPLPAQDIKEEVQVGLQSLQVEPRAKEKDVPEEVEELDENEEAKKRHLNVVFIGHVDAGKSTIGGQILFLSGQVDERTIQKYEKEAKDKSRESWYMAYIMDTNAEEREKGITVEVGRAHFETENTRFTILDAPGHKSYVPNMISGASQADIGVLVISARKGEFETGYEKGGQTREHVQLAKTLGVTKLVVVVNKMDDPTVGWSKERYDEIESKMTPFLKSSGYNVKKDVQFLPISGLLGANMKTRMTKSICNWYNGTCLFEVLDSIEVPLRDPKGPVRMPIIDKYKDMGTVVMGKIESGSIREGDSLLVMPNKASVKVLSVYCDENKVRRAGPGENVRVKLAGVEEEDILAGFVLSSVANPVNAVLEFNAQLQILELLDNAIFTAGYKAILHIHSIVEECEIVELIEEIDMKKKKDADAKKKKPKRKPLFVKTGAIVVCRIQVCNLICVENFSDFTQLGRFTLRTEGKTVAVGKVVALPPPGSSTFA